MEGLEIWGITAIVLAPLLTLGIGLLGAKWIKVKAVIAAIAAAAEDDKITADELRQIIQEILK